MLYGAAGPKLRNMLVYDSGIDEEIATLKFCEDTAKGWFKGYPGIDKFIKETHIDAKRNLYVETIVGRKRRLYELETPPPPFPGKNKKGTPIYDDWKRKNNIYQGALRQGVNSIIQGSAADLMKIVMVKIYDSIESGRWDVNDKKCKILTQVHDELNFECPEEVAEEFKEFVIDMMEEVGKLLKIIVPIKGDGNCSASGGAWSEAK